MSKKTIVHLTSEVAPFYKRGGLGDVAGSLPLYLKEAGDNYVISFHYKGQMKGLENAEETLFMVPIHGIAYPFRCYSIRKAGVDFFFIDLDDENVFCEAEGGSKPQQKGSGKTAYQEVLPMTTHFYFAKAALYWIKRKGIPVNFLLLHDWHVCGIFAYEQILTFFRQKFSCRTLCLIHNYQFQGELIPDSLPFLDEESQLAVRRMYRKYHSASLLGLAIERSDFLATVSKGYAYELMEQRAPHVNYKYLNSRNDQILDFTNGVDYTIWHPESSPFLSVKYNDASLERKEHYKKRLQEHCGFTTDDRPTALLMARLAPQKGIYLLMNANWSDAQALAQIKEVLDTGVRLIVYGEAMGGKGSRIDHLFSLACQHFPENFYYDGDYTESKAHQYLAGADLLLAPSFFEPCGLVQLYAMAFGTVPLVNPVGGLGETVKGYPECPVATGFKMEDYSTASLIASLQAAQELYTYHPTKWQELQLRGMQSDFSWEKMVQKYYDFFELPVAIQV